jgi:hypothetical protein
VSDAKTSDSAAGTPEPDNDVMSSQANESEVRASNDGTAALGEDPDGGDSSFGAAGSPDTTTETGAGVGEQDQ